jgi:hypothetical protein
MFAVAFCTSSVVVATESKLESKKNTANQHHNY